MPSLEFEITGQEPICSIETSEEGVKELRPLSETEIAGLGADTPFKLVIDGATDTIARVPLDEAELAQIEADRLAYSRTMPPSD